MIDKNFLFNMWKRIKTFFSNLFETEKPNSEDMKRYNTKRICICCGNVYQVKNGRYEVLFTQMYEPDTQEIVVIRKKIFGIFKKILIIVS